MHAWQHLERTGRIRHTRFSITRDLVPLVPFCNFEIDDLQFYKHVGMRVQLHGIGRIGKWRLRRNLDVTYPLQHDWPSEIRRIFMNTIFANLTSLSGKYLQLVFSLLLLLVTHGVFFCTILINRSKEQPQIDRVPKAPALCNDLQKSIRLRCVLF